jgi:nucleoside-diphosphate-sugar epimerase
MRVANELKSLRKIIITSSMLVCYGGYYPKNQFDYKPSTVYGESKVETERIVWANKPVCDWAIIRPTSIWGPWFGVPYKNFFDMILAKKYFHIGNKGCTKTYGYVGNAIYQIEKILFSETKDESKKVFFIGDNPPTDIEEWGNEIASELGFRITKMPYLVIKSAALFGDFLKSLNLNFPMNSFRLHNMTTDNIIDLKNTDEIAPILPYSRKEGIQETLKWMNKYSD